MADIVTDLGINLMEEEIDEVIFQTNQFLTDATFTGSQGPFWWILQMCMALAALFSIIVAAGLAYKMMIKHEPLDILKLFRPLAVSIVSAGGILRRTRASATTAARGACWISSRTSRTPSAPIRTTSIRRRHPRSVTASMRCRACFTSGTPCTRTSRRRRMSPARAPPTRHWWK